jgi:excisionase family DNA binding protein
LSALPKGDALLTTEEVAALLHVHPCTVRRLRAARKLTTVKVESAVRITASSVRAYIACNTVGGAA